MENIQYFIYFHLLVQVWRAKKSKKKYSYLKKKTWMHIKYVINQHHCDKIKNYPCVED
jgi:hypothetical protein